MAAIRHDLYSCCLSSYVFLLSRSQWLNVALLVPTTSAPLEQLDIPRRAKVVHELASVILENPGSIVWSDVLLIPCVFIPIWNQAKQNHQLCTQNMKRENVEKWVGTVSEQMGLGSGQGFGMDWVWVGCVLEAVKRTLPATLTTDCGTIMNAVQM